MARVFLPGIGFRDAGLRLGQPTTVRSPAGRALTVTELVSTAESTDLIYEVERRPDETDLHCERDRVVMHGASTDPACRPGSMSIAVRAGKLVCTRVLPPVAAGVQHVDLEIAGEAGEWRIPLDLAGFGDDQRSVDLEASDTRDGVTISVYGAAQLDDAVAIDLRVSSDRRTRRVGIGGLGGMRDGTTAMRLRDERGRTYVERTRNDARDQFPDPSGGADVAIFDRLPEDAGALVLEVPFVCIDDQEPQAEIALPVSGPREVQFGPCRIRVLGTREADSAAPWSRGPALAVDLDLGGWQGDVRVLKPFGARIDGEARGVLLGRGMYGPAPEPTSYIQVSCGAPADARTLTLMGVTLQKRGRWRIRIPLG